MRHHIAGFATLALVFAAPAQAATIFTFDPATAGLTGGAFSADTFTGTEVSVITNSLPNASGGFSWHEHGYLEVTGATLGGSAVTTSGLNSSYSLFLAFDINGYQPSILSPGYSTSATLSLEGVAGPTSFSIDWGTLSAVADTGAYAVTDLANLTNSHLTTTATVISVSPLELALHATLGAGFNPNSGSGFGFAGSPIFVNGVFDHPSSGVDVLYGGGVFVIQGGNDVVSFDVPEPATMTLLGFGFAGLGAWRHRRAKPKAI